MARGTLCFRAIGEEKILWGQWECLPASPVLWALEVPQSPNRLWLCGFVQV